MKDSPQTPPAPQPSTGEPLGVQIERVRLTLEHARVDDQRSRTFLQQWQVDTGPVHDLMLGAMDRGFGYAKMTIQSLFFLNGGALIAFPTFAKLADIKFAAHLGLALPSIFSFVAGLVLITLTGLSAYFTSFVETQGAWQYSEALKYGLHLARDPEEKLGQWKAERAKAEAKANEFRTTAERRRWIAIGLGVASLVTFIVGALFAALVLLDAGG